MAKRRTKVEESEQYEADSDVEEGDLLDEDEPDVHIKYDKAQRELVTQPVDYNLETLANLVKQGRIDLNPRYQRRQRWDEVRQSKLIESFLMSVPVPPIFLAEQEYAKYAVIDGRQRLTAITKFFSNLLELQGLDVFDEINDKRFGELPSDLQTILKVRPIIRAIIILRQSDPEIQFQVFERLNSGGVALNAQELRNSAYRGKLNDLILRIADVEKPTNKFYQVLRIKPKEVEKSKLVQMMRDCELVLRFFALKDSYESFSGSMKRTLNSYMRENLNPSPEDSNTLEQEFYDSLDIVQQAFGDKAFRRWNTKGQKWGNQVLASLFDAQMIAAHSVRKKKLKLNQSRVVQKLQSLFEDDQFNHAVSAGTNARLALKERIDRIRHLLVE